MSDTICEQCGKAPAEYGGWFCTPCTDALLEGYAGTKSTDGVEDEVCSGCAAAPASLFGVCDDCYDEAYNTRNPTGRPSAYSPGWWEYESAAPVTVPAFAEEVTHHNLKASLAVA